MSREEVQAIVDGYLATAATSTPSSLPSEIPDEIRDFYASTYLDLSNHKAFAMAIGNFPEQREFASASGHDFSRVQGAINEAMRRCEKLRENYGVARECRIYAINDTIVWGMSREEVQAIVDSY